jgi:hypothetical protein
MHDRLFAAAMALALAHRNADVAPLNDYQKSRLWDALYGALGLPAVAVPRAIASPTPGQDAVKRQEERKKEMSRYLKEVEEAARKEIEQRKQYPAWPQLTPPAFVDRYAPNSITEPFSGPFSDGGAIVNTDVSPAPQLDVRAEVLAQVDADLGLLPEQAPRGAQLELDMVGGGACKASTEKLVETRPRADVEPFPRFPRVAHDLRRARPRK